MVKFLPPVPRLEDYVAVLINDGLENGKRIRMGVSDLMRMSRYFLLPDYIDAENKQAVGSYCNHILSRFKPKNGSVNVERLGRSTIYEFIPVGTNWGMSADCVAACVASADELH